MSNVIVGIHGLANKPPSEILKECWAEAIKEGLNETCRLKNPDLELHTVHWAHLLYKYPMHNDTGFNFDNLYNKEPYIKAREGALKPYEQGWLDDARAVALSAGGAAIDGLKRHFGLNGLADMVLGLVVKDLAFYYDENRHIDDGKGGKGVARKVLGDVLKDKIMELEDHRIMLIAHSMGSIVAYDVLRDIGRERSDFEMAQFVTIGSPLGLPPVKANIHRERSKYDQKTPVRTPSIVTESWVNYADRKDPVALDIYLNGDYKANRRNVEVVDDLVCNDYVGLDGEPNHHKSYGYLRTPEISRQIERFISS